MPATVWRHPRNRDEWDARIALANGDVPVGKRTYLWCMAAQLLGVGVEFFATFELGKPVVGLIVWVTCCVVPAAIMLWPWIRSRRHPKDVPANLAVAQVPDIQRNCWQNTPGTFLVLLNIRTSGVPLLVGDLPVLDQLVEAARENRRPVRGLTRRKPVTVARQATIQPIQPPQPAVSVEAVQIARAQPRLSSAVGPRITPCAEPANTLPLAVRRISQTA